MPTPELGKLIHAANKEMYKRRRELEEERDMLAESLSAAITKLGEHGLA